MKNIETERKLLQNAVAICALGPMIMGFLGYFWGDWLTRDPLPALVFSQLKFLSGIMLAISFVFFSCIRSIETKASRFGVFALLVVSGGITQISSLSFSSFSSIFYSTLISLSLVYSLILVPGLYIWMYRFAKRY